MSLRVAGIVSAAGLVFVLAACGGHGKYTAEHLSGAKVKMGAMKAATEYQMAHQAFLAGDLEKAAKHVDYSLGLNQKVAKSHVLKGRIFLEMNDLEKASLCLAEAEKIEPQNVEAAYYQGVLAERVARKDEAYTHYSKAAELDPANAQYVIAASEMLIDLGRADEAQSYLEGKAGQFLNNAGVKQVLGNIAMLKGDTVAAERLFGEARLLAPDDQLIQENLVRAQVANQKYADADSLISKLLADPKGKDRTDLMHLHAKCLSQLGRPVEAREVYLNLTRDQAGQTDAEAWKGLGQTAFVLRDKIRLKLSAARLIAIAPQSPDGYVLRGLLNRLNGETQAALMNFQQAVKLSRTSDNLVLLGMTQQDLNLIVQARQSYRTALTVNPKDATAARLLSAVGSD